MKTPFTQAELTELSNCIKKHQPFVVKPDVELHLKRWAAFIEEVRQGYSMDIDNFMNDASSRGILEDLMKTCAAELSGRLAELLKPTDKVFLELTELTKDATEQDPFWNSRIPKQSPNLDENEFKFWRRK